LFDYIYILIGPSNKYCANRAVIVYSCYVINNRGDDQAF